MWKKVCCATLVSVSHQVEELRSVKAAFLRGQSELVREWETSLDGRGEVTWCKGKEGHVRWEQFLDLLTVVKVMLFSGRLLLSGSASALGCPGTWYALKKKKKQTPQNLRDVPGPVELTHSALLYNLSCGTWCRPLTPSRSVSLAPFRVSFLFRFYQFFFQPNFFSLCTSTSPHRIHHHTLTSICCLPSVSWLVIVFLLGLAGLYSQMVCCLLTNVSYSLASITGVLGWSQAEPNEIPKATISYFWLAAFCFLRFSLLLGCFWSSSHTLPVSDFVMKIVDCYVANNLIFLCTNCALIAQRNTNLFFVFLFTFTYLGCVFRSWDGVLALIPVLAYSSGLGANLCVSCLYSQACLHTQFHLGLFWRPVKTQASGTNSVCEKKKVPMHV